MGDIWDVDPKELAEKIRGHLLPHMIILSTAAPPCKDHSKIRDAPPGVTGHDGSLLQHTVDIELSLRQLLPEFRFETLMENVIPHENVQSHFDDITDQWGSQPIVCDAADGNMEAGTSGSSSNRTTSDSASGALGAAPSAGSGSSLFSLASAFSASTRAAKLLLHSSV